MTVESRWDFYYTPADISERVEFTQDEDIIAYFTEGQCGALAYELHKLTGWTLALVSDSPVGSDDYCGHVFVINSDGQAVDIKGVRPIEEVRQEWYFCSYLHRFYSTGEFEFELDAWECSPAYNKDPEAKLWARTILNSLGW